MSYLRNALQLGPPRHAGLPGLLQQVGVLEADLYGPPVLRPVDAEQLVDLGKLRENSWLENSLTPSMVYNGHLKF